MDNQRRGLACGVSLSARISSHSRQADASNRCRTRITVVRRLLRAFGSSRVARARPFPTTPAARRQMKRFLDFLWPLIGLVAVVVSIWLLSKEFKGEAVASQVWTQFSSISLAHYSLCILSALLAYAALTWYDRIALIHLGIRHIPLSFVALCSFTTYALSHTIGASVFSGAMVRYRAYSTKGLGAGQVAILVALCSITFGLGVLLIGGLVLILEPQELRRVGGMLPNILTNTTTARLIGIVSLAAVLAYVIGSAMRLPPFTIGRFRVDYPRPAITARQLIAAPLELIGAAGILYFALPEAGNPGYVVVLAIFLGAFSAALVSNAPGGAGVFDLLFINALPTIPKTKVLAAVLMFRLFYLLIPLAFAIVVVILFERRRLRQTLHHDLVPGLEPQADRPPVERRSA
jgi:uncharacterized membrane protein YbhN (UPF0104 family)